MTKKILTTLAVLVVLTASVFLLVPSNHPLGATTTTIDNFNSDTKSTGDLNGQDGWTGSATFDAVTSAVIEGDQLVENSDPTGAKIISLPSFPMGAVATGVFTFYLQKSNTTTFDAYVRFCESGESGSTCDGKNLGGAYLAETGNVKLLADTEFDTGIAYSADTTVKIEIEVDVAGDQTRIRVDSGSWSAWKTTLFSANVSGLIFKKQGQVDTSRWDAFSYDDGVTPAAGGAKKVPDIIQLF